MNIDIRAIPHQNQRYATVGDYWEDKNGTHFRISKMSDPRYEQLVLIHELVEYFLVKLAGISLADIDAFDEAFEHLRADDDDSEPGDDDDAPYYRQHQAATVVERACAFFMDVDWKLYDKVVNEL